MGNVEQIYEAEVSKESDDAVNTMSLMISWDMKGEDAAGAWISGWDSGRRSGLEWDMEFISTQVKMTFWGGWTNHETRVENRDSGCKW